MENESTSNAENAVKITCTVKTKRQFTIIDGIAICMILAISVLVMFWVHRMCSSLVADRPSYAPTSTITANVTELYSDDNGTYWVKVDANSISAQDKGFGRFAKDIRSDLKETEEIQLGRIDNTNITVSDSGKNTIKIDIYDNYSIMASYVSLNVSQDLYDKIQNVKNNTAWKNGQ